MINEKIMAAILIGLVVFIILWVILHRRKHPKFLLQTIFLNKTHPFMASINSIVLTDTQTHTGLIVVVDSNGNSYTGTLSNAVLTGFDPTQDNFAIDPTATSTL